MEMTDRLLSLTRDQQLKVMGRVFQKLILAFGNQMQAKWQGIDIQEVYRDWAEKLQNFSLGAINHAILLAQDSEFPPSLGSFCELCRQYKPQMNDLRLEKLHVKDTEKGMAEIHRIKEMLAAKMRVDV